MKIDYNITGEKRKELVKIISSASGFESKYLGTPTYAYQVGPYIITRDGTVEVDENECSIDEVINAAVAAGYIGNMEEEQEEPELGSITISKEGMTPAMVENLQKIIIGKAALIRRAFGTAVLPVLEEHDKITFSWFPDLGPDTAPAYAEFMSRLRTMAMEAKRVTMSEKPVENEKYAWRCFLIRLGFIGPEYKEIRKVLMKNFTGNSAFKNEKRKESEDE